jgi:putative addiction module killer protein
VYFGRLGSVVVVLLVGGDKATQAKDIKLAKACWASYLEEQKDG